MTKIKLFHRILLNADEVNKAGSWKVAKYEMRHIASKYDDEWAFKDNWMNDCTDEELLDFVYKKSNHGVPGQTDNWAKDRYWDEIIPKFEECRSTIVGDLVSLQKDDGNVMVYQVECVGWTKVADLPAVVLS
jgi:hypothetical protein